MVKTYKVGYRRFFKGTGKFVNEAIQVDAKTCDDAKRKTKSFFKKTSTTPIRINKCSIAKRKKPDYLRI